mmetsp:Transcript_24722/g.50091  ORF Transcript_24722/g.50091 Transcript_24722/m.50091 type:complete len:226 (-) Transcript_24722:22-699(-)
MHIAVGRGFVDSCRSAFSRARVAAPLPVAAVGRPLLAACGASASGAWPSASARQPECRALVGGFWWQRRWKITIPEKDLTKRVSRSSGAGGQSVNMADTRVQLSFQLGKADWIPADVRAKMKVMHKNRINKKGEFSVTCQVTSSQLDNYRIALKNIGELIEEAQVAVSQDKYEAEKVPFKEYHLEKKKRDGREQEIEKHVEAIKGMKKRSRERTNDKARLKKMSF